MKEAIEEFKRKIEEGEWLYIPKYVEERLDDYLLSLRHINVNKVWREIKRSYYRGDTADLYRDKRHIVAYLRYYYFLNYPAIKWILFKNLEKGMDIIPKRDGVINVLDYGAGPGTASMAICDFIKEAREAEVYRNTKVRLFFVEKVEDFIICYKKMLRRHEIVDREPNRDYIEQVHGIRKDCYDIIIASYVLNELSRKRDLRNFLKTILYGLKNGGHLIIVESAYKEKRDVWDFLKSEWVRGSFKIVDASGPLCSEESCKLRDRE